MVLHRFIAGSSKCTTKELSSLLTKILTVIKTGLEKYCSTKTSHTGVNNMWILNASVNSKHQHPPPPEVLHSTAALGPYT